MPTRGKRVAWIAGAGAIVVLLVAGIANERRLRECWWLYKLHSEGVETQRVAADKLGDLGSLAAIPELLRIATDLANRSRGFPWRGQVMSMDECAVWTLEAIGQRKDPEGLRLWIDALGSEDPRVRVVATLSINQLGSLGAGAIPALVRALHDDRSPSWIKSLEISMPGPRRWLTIIALRNLGEPGRAALASSVKTATPELRGLIESVLAGWSAPARAAQL